jgi:hypothetical protein
MERLLAEQGVFPAQPTTFLSGGGDTRYKPTVALPSQTSYASTAAIAAWMLCVPGGFGTIAALADQQYLTQLRRRSDFALSSELVCERCNKLVYEMTSARVTV